LIQTNILGDKMSIKKAIATGAFLEDRKEQAINVLADIIANSFTVLANTEPGVALAVLEQLNDQFNEDKAKEMIEQHEKQINNMADKMALSPDDLD